MTTHRCGDTNCSATSGDNWPRIDGSWRADEKAGEREKEGGRRRDLHGDVVV